MDHDKPVYSGNLLVPPAGKILIKKSWQQKYCMLFKGSKFGRERLEIYDNSDSTKQTPSRIITLQDCIKIIPRNPPFFSVITKSGLYDFEATSTGSMSEWLAAFQSVAFPDDISKITSVEEDNDLYCSSGEGIFNVKLHPSPASLRCGLEAKTYLLVLTNHGAQLRNCHDNALLFTWPYCFIRRYGYKNGKFTFEAGRKCESGEGVFFMEYADLHEIFRCFASKIKSMKKLLSNEPILDMDNSFHVALGMEARSRSPLPALLTSSTSLHSIEQNLSNNNTIPETSELLGVAKPFVPPKPVKPPRKNLPIKSKDQKSLYETVNKYDWIEYRSEAWKTLGVNEVSHEELDSSEYDDDYMSWGVKRPPNFPPPVVQAPKVINEPPLHQEDYDKLSYFGTASKSTAARAYKQVKVTSHDFANPPSFNEYDEVELGPVHHEINVVNGEGDKQQVSLPQAPVNHQFHNNEPYAVISKPKRV